MFGEPIKNFLGSFEKKFQHQKWGFVRIFQPDFEFHFFTFPDIKSDWCVVRSRFFYWRKEIGLVDHSDTLNMFVKPIENFLEAFEPKLQFKKMSKNETQNRVGIFWQNPIFWAETFFQRPLENFLLARRTCSRYLKGPLNLAVCVSKKIVTILVTTHQ